MYLLHFSRLKKITKNTEVGPHHSLGYTNESTTSEWHCHCTMLVPLLHYCQHSMHKNCSSYHDIHYYIFCRFYSVAIWMSQSSWPTSRQCCLVFWATWTARSRRQVRGAPDVHAST